MSIQRVEDVDQGDCDRKAVTVWEEFGDESSDYEELAEETTVVRGSH
jgi:hypothetical protein